MVRLVALGVGRAFLIAFWGVLGVVFLSAFPRPFVEPGWPIIAGALLVAVGVLAAWVGVGGAFGRLVAMLAGGLAAYAFDLHLVRTVAAFRPWAVSTLPTDRWREESLLSIAVLGLALSAGFAGATVWRHLMRRSSEASRFGAPLVGLALIVSAAIGVAFLYGRPPITEPEGIQTQRVTTTADSVHVDPTVISAGETAFVFVAPSPPERQWWYVALEGPTPVLERLDQGELRRGDFGPLQVEGLAAGESGGWYAGLRPGSYEWQLVQPTFDEAAQTVTNDVVARAAFVVRDSAAAVAPVEPGWVASASAATYLGLLGLHLLAALAAAGAGAIGVRPRLRARAAAVALGLTGLLWFLGTAWVELVKNPL